VITYSAYMLDLFVTIALDVAGTVCFSLITHRTKH